MAAASWVFSGTLEGGGGGGGYVGRFGIHFHHILPSIEAMSTEQSNQIFLNKFRVKLQNCSHDSHVKKVIILKAFPGVLVPSLFPVDRNVERY